MKNIFGKTIVLGMLTLATTSCSDLLKEEPYTQIEQDQFISTASEAEVVLNGVYRGLVSDNTYGLNLSLMLPITTDIAQCEGSTTSGFREVPTNAFTTSNAAVQNTWKSLYNAIYNTNDFIERLAHNMASLPVQDQKLAQMYLGEAHALRALYYFDLLRWYGHIVLMRTTADSHRSPGTFQQATPEEVYAFIENDLKIAIETLPYAVDDQLRNDNSFRFSKGAALGLLSKVYATWAGYPVHDISKWTLAAQTAKLLIDSGKHGLLSSYEQLWKNTCNGEWDPTESLIEVSFYAPTISGNRNLDPVGRIGKWNGVVADAIAGVRGRNSGVVKVVYTFYRDWEKGEQDLRRQLSIANYKYKGTKKEAYSDKTPDEDQKKWQIMTPAKWDTEKYVEPSNLLVNADKSNINWYILRYADVLLLYAEALNESEGSPTSQAYEAVNMVRRRGFGLPITQENSLCDLPEGLSQEEFRDAVRKERSYELCFEGHRRQDLVRWGTYYETIMSTAQKLVDWYSNANYTAADYTKKNKHELLPIPQHETDMMKISQNPGWN
jgi:hypothetical protein